MIYDVLKEQLTGYLVNQISLDDLESWLVGQMQDILDSADQRAIEAANSLDNLFILKSEGLASEDDIRAMVFKLLSPSGKAVSGCYSSALNVQVYETIRQATPTLYNQHVIGAVAAGDR